jgi:zinc protease
LLALHVEPTRIHHQHQPRRPAHLITSAALVADISYESTPSPSAAEERPRGALPLIYGSAAGCPVRRASLRSWAEDPMTRFLRTGGLLGLAATLAIAPAMAAPAPGAAPAPAALRPPDRPTDPVIPFERYTLDNGLEVILVADTRSPLVAVNLWYHVGSGNEQPGKSGFAHLFEHMLYQGSQHVGNDRYFPTMSQAGATEVNGSTNSDRTNYYGVVPSNQLETMLWLESDRMGYLLPTVNETSFRNQVEVVRNERRFRVDNEPYGKSEMALYDALYPGDHPYRYAVIGRHEDLDGATVGDVTAFFKTWYVPANATIALVGDFEVETAKRLVDKWFGRFPKSTKPVTVPVPPPAIQSKRIEVKDEFAKLRRITWAWHSPAMYQPGDAELDIASDILARTGTGRLYKLLVHERQLAQSVSADQDPGQFSSVFSISVTLRTGADEAEVRRLALAEIERLRREPATEREIQRTAAGRERSVVFRLESLMARAETLQRYNHYLGDPGRLSWDLDRFRKATPEAVRAAAAAALVPERRIEIVTVPSQGGSK